MPVWTYEAIQGFFVQDKPTVVSTVIGPTPDYFGLQSRSWHKFVSEVNELFSRRSESVSYKVFFLGRHGEGYHNEAIAKYGREEWNEKWTLLNGDGELTWGPDPYLTAIGEEEARNARAAWKRELLRGAPVPQRFYCSPFRRTIRTFGLTFEGILSTDLKPVILENCRERYGESTCNKRRTFSELQSEFPNVVFEEGFEEEDVLWTSECENDENLERRAKLVLDGIFQKDCDDTYISITAHSAWIKAVLRVVGRKNYNLPTGGIILVVVKGTLL